jgi:hypothetical protein
LQLHEYPTALTSWRLLDPDPEQEVEVKSQAVENKEERLNDTRLFLRIPQKRWLSQIALAQVTAARLVIIRF